MVKKSIVHGKGSNGKPQLPIPALPAVEDSASLSSPTDALAATTLAANGHHPKATASPAGAKAKGKAVDKRLPVTLLSGFLGAGKTTLLRHLLASKSIGRCAVIVNDMAELNIDGVLVKSGGLVQAQEELVELSNGCICCTLRGDLLREVGRLAAAGVFDYCLIESTGVSEPMQVAKTFTMELEDGSVFEDGSAAELASVARLDTCVTLADAGNLMANFGSLQSLAQREPGRVDEADDRNVADLLLDQIEFADVILLNKADMVPKREVGRLTTLLRALNPEARIHVTKESRVAPKEVVGTGRFSMERAARAAGWIKTLQEGEVVTPETEEYGIASFVYRARRPFHPGRLHAFVAALFTLQQPDYAEALASDEDEGNEGQEGKESDKEDDEHHASGAKAGPSPEEAQAVLQRQQRLFSAFGQVLRSKGFMWLAGREDLCGEWSQAGGILRVGVGDLWFAALPDEAWPTDKSARAEIHKDFQEPMGDRRQELVFIGCNMRRAELVRALDACLVTDAEQASQEPLADPFVKWPGLDSMLVSTDEDSEEESGEEDESGEADEDEEEGNEGEVSDGNAAASAPSPTKKRRITRNT